MNATVTGQSVETVSMRLGATAAAEIELASVPVTSFARVAWQDVLRDEASGGSVVLASGQRIAGHRSTGILDGTEVEFGVSSRIGDDFRVHASWTVSPFEDARPEGGLAFGVGVQF